MIEKIYIDALLAAAAYAKWDRPEVEIKAELINKRGFTDEQYKTLFEGDENKGPIYEVYGGPSVGYIELNNGFSATIFRNVDQSSPDYDQLTVAFRGTDPWTVDFITDLLALLGNPDSVLEYFFNQNNNVDDFLIANNLILDGQLTQAVNFTGHSLGGYLALMTSYKYSASFGETYTFNGLGLNPIENFWEDIKNTFLGRPLDDSKIHNYFADKGWEGASHPLLSKPGGQEPIFIEEYDGLVDVTFKNHSIAKLVQSLSVYRVLATLAPDLDTDAGLGTIYRILDAASNSPGESLQTIVVQLGDLLGGGFPALDDIELFYKEAVEQGKTYSINNITGSLATLASQDNDVGLGYRYALVNLLPFAITSNLAGTAADDPQYDAANFSAAYLADRAQMLELLITRNTLDITTSDSLDENLDDALYIDQTTNLKLTTGAISLIGVTDTTDRIYFGDEITNVSVVGIDRGKRERIYFSA